MRDVDGKGDSVRSQALLEGTDGIPGGIKAGENFRKNSCQRRVS